MGENMKHLIYNKLQRLLVVVLVLFGTAEGYAQQKHNVRTPTDPATVAVKNVSAEDEAAAEEWYHRNILTGKYEGSKIYPNTVRNFKIYVPEEYDGSKPACLLLGLDGTIFNDITVMTNLMKTGEMPLTIGVFLEPGVVYREDSTAKSGKAVVRYNRSNEFDRTNAEFVTFLETEFLPFVETLSTTDGRKIRLSHDANDRAITGASSSGIAAFTVAWERPDLFSRVYSSVGTFVAMRGGNEYPALVRKTEPKPLRIFLQDGVNDTWNYIFGDWWEQNQLMASALNFAGYEFDYKWDRGNHGIYYGRRAYPDAMRWLWRGWPARVEAGESMNGMLKSLLVPGEGWKEIGCYDSVGRYVNADSAGADCNRIELLPDSKVLAAGGGMVHVASGNSVVLLDSLGNRAELEWRKVQGYTVVADFPMGGPKIDYDNLKGDRVLDNGIVTADSKTVYVKDQKVASIKNAVSAVCVKYLKDSVWSRRAYVSDMDGNIWMIDGIMKSKKDGGINLYVNPKDLSVKKMNTIENGGSQMAIYPDHRMLITTEKNSNWLISYLIKEDGTLEAGQRFYWLHNTENHTHIPYGNMVFDLMGNLYIATPEGIQVCDQNGRVRAILPVPGRKADAIAFSERHLFVISGGKLYVRRVNHKGYNHWVSAYDVKSQGQG